MLIDVTDDNMNVHSVDTSAITGIQYQSRHPGNNLYYLQIVGGWAVPVRGSLQEIKRAIEAQENISSERAPPPRLQRPSNDGRTPVAQNNFISLTESYPLDEQDNAEE